QLLEGAALVNDALPELVFPRTTGREGAGLIEAALAVLEDAAAGEAALNDAVLDHVEAGFGCQGPEEDEIGPVDHVLAFALGVITEFLVGVIDVIEEVDPVLGGLVDEVDDLVGDDGDGGHLSRGVVWRQGREGALENFRGVSVRVTGQAAQEALWSLNRVGNGDVFDVGQEFADFAES